MKASAWVIVMHSRGDRALPLSSVSGARVLRAELARARAATRTAWNETSQSVELVLGAPRRARSRTAATLLVRDGWVAVVSANPRLMRRFPAPVVAEVLRLALEDVRHLEQMLTGERRS